MKNLITTILITFGLLSVRAQSTDVKLGFPSIKGKVEAAVAKPAEAGINELQFTRVSSFLVDGGIRDVTAGTTDKTASGIIGYRRNNLFSRWDFSIASLSTATSINSADVTDYSRTILNPYNATSGISLNGNYLRRHFSKKAEIVSRLIMLKQMDKLTQGQYDATINDKDAILSDAAKRPWAKVGFAVEFQVSSISWTKYNTETKAEGNLIALNPYLIKNIRFYDDITEDFIEVIVGIGPSLRVLRGDLGKQHDILMSSLKTDSRTFKGAQATFQVFFKNFYAKSYYGVYSKPGDIEIAGLTGGQFYLSIGITAEIGANKTIKKSIADLLK